MRFAPGISVKAETQLGNEQGLDSTLMLQKLAFQICKSINDVTPVTPKSILASILLCHERNALSLEEILRASELLGNYTTWAHAELSCGVDPVQLRRSVENTVKKLLGNQTLETETAVPVRYFLEDRKRINMVFYKNNAIHCFVMPSITSLSMARTRSQQREQILKHAFSLRNIFKFEFFFSPSSIFSAEVNRTIDYFKQPAFSGDLSVFLRLNRDIIESYLIAFETIQNEAVGEQELKTALQKVVREAVQRVEEKKGFVTECVSTQNFTNAFKLMENIALIEFKRDSDQVLISLRPWNEEANEILTELREFYSALMNPPRGTNS